MLVLSSKKFVDRNDQSRYDITKLMKPRLHILIFQTTKQITRLPFRHFRKIKLRKKNLKRHSVKSKERLIFAKNRNLFK